MNYDPYDPKSQDVYLCLIEMYLSPPNLSDLGINIPNTPTQPEANVRDALSVLTKHHQLIDTVKVRACVCVCVCVRVCVCIGVQIQSRTESL